MKDPIHYFLIVPLILIVLQFIVIILLYTFRKRFDQWVDKLNAEQEVKGLKTRKELLRAAESLRQERIKATHAKLLNPDPNE